VGRAAQAARAALVRQVPGALADREAPGLRPSRPRPIRGPTEEPAAPLPAATPATHPIRIVPIHGPLRRTSPKIQLTQTQATRHRTIPEPDLPTQPRRRRIRAKVTGKTRGGHGRTTRAAGPLQPHPADSGTLAPASERSGTAPVFETCSSDLFGPPVQANAARSWRVNCETTFEMTISGGTIMKKTALIIAFAIAGLPAAVGQNGGAALGGGAGGQGGTGAPTQPAPTNPSPNHRPGEAVPGRNPDTTPNPNRPDQRTPRLNDPTPQNPADPHPNNSTPQNPGAGRTNPTTPPSTPR
jgi:hypothetical protein